MRVLTARRLQLRKSWASINGEVLFPSLLLLRTGGRWGRTWGKLVDPMAGFGRPDTGTDCSRHVDESTDNIVTVVALSAIERECGHVDRISREGLSERDTLHLRHALTGLRIAGILQRLLLNEGRQMASSQPNFALERTIDSRRHIAARSLDCWETTARLRYRRLLSDLTWEAHISRSEGEASRESRERVQSCTDRKGLHLSDNNTGEILKCYCST